MLYAQENGAHIWSNAASGSANASITFAERMRINSGGGLDLTTTTAGALTGGANRQGSVIKLKHNINHEAGYTGGDFLGGIEFESGDGSSGTGVRTAIRTEATDPYNTHSLKFYTANSNSTSISERMAIDHNGRVTMPYQPAFDAYHAGGSYASGTTVTSLDLNSTRLNRGGHYSTSNDRFIAPVAGVYMFYYRAIVNGAYTNLHLRFRKNSTVVIGGSDTHLTTASGWHQFHTQVTVQLAANDFVQVEHTTNTNIYGDSYQSFSGHLIG